MKIAIPAETDPGEPRVAATPDTVKRIVGMGAEVTVEKGAGERAGVLDKDFEGAGAKIASGKDAVGGADIVLKVRRPSKGEISGYKPGTVVIAIMDPFGHEAALAEMAGAQISAFAMELMPRITRAQVMDVLSSQANLAGYRAVIDAAAEYGRALPMMMTAAGTVPAARAFVMGAGGGNGELAEPDKVVVHNGVKVVSFLNVPGRLAATSSALYAKNLLAFLDVLVKDKKLSVPWEDEIVKATLLTRDGAVVHPNFKPKGAA